VNSQASSCRDAVDYDAPDVTRVPRGDRAAQEPSATTVTSRCPAPRPNHDRDTKTTSASRCDERDGERTGSRFSGGHRGGGHEDDHGVERARSPTYGSTCSCEDGPCRSDRTLVTLPIGMPFGKRELRRGRSLKPRRRRHRPSPDDVPLAKRGRGPSVSRVRARGARCPVASVRRSVADAAADSSVRSWTARRLGVTRVTTPNEPVGGDDGVVEAPPRRSTVPR
jgi:hypothetical protein